MSQINICGQWSYINREKERERAKINANCQRSDGVCVLVVDEVDDSLARQTSGIYNFKLFCGLSLSYNDSNNMAEAHSRTREELCVGSVVARSMIRPGSEHAKQQARHSPHHRSVSHQHATNRHHYQSHFNICLGFIGVFSSFLISRSLSLSLSLFHFSFSSFLCRGCNVF